MTIYAIDDEKAALGLLEMAINEAVPGADVKTFRRVSEMLASAAENAPDVVFTDIEMPGMNGLELCKKLQALNPDVNIVFVTGYSEFALDALKLYASDYILKPVDADAVKKAMSNLRNPVKGTGAEITVKTFGIFSVFVNGKPVAFRMEKSRELLAYLIDREGASVTRRQIASVLYEDGNFDRNDQKYLSRAAQWLEQDLETAGIGRLFRNINGEYSVDASLVDCDLYRYLAGEHELFHGEYMEQYSWGEDRKALMS